MKQLYIAIQGAASAAIAFISAKLGIMFPVLAIMMAAMVIDYITGMLASKKEAIEHPGDPEYGWSSKKGAKGIIKKAGYICVVAAAAMADYIIITVTASVGYDMPVKAMLALMVAVWYILNELLSITENAGRMGAPVPEWLSKYIAVLKDKIDEQGGKTDE